MENERKEHTAFLTYDEIVRALAEFIVRRDGLTVTERTFRAGIEFDIEDDKIELAKVVLKYK